MALPRRWAAHPSLLPVLAALAVAALIALVCFGQTRADKTVLMGVPGFQVPDEQLKGAPFLPESLRDGLPHQYSAKHPLGMVQVSYSH